ncbi:MAG: hypothetical protein IJX68_08835 [Rikenellaceae bacterium]|nr:hypothetical protein [Rikenellaceae bacterium]
MNIFQEALLRAACGAEGTRALVESKTNKIASTANALGGGYRTPKWHDHDTGETKGNTQPAYDGNVQKRNGKFIGIVYTANYSAQKDNMEHNTLLKAKG